MAILNVVGGNPILPRTMWLALRAHQVAGDAMAASPHSLGAPGDGGHVRAAKQGAEKLGLDSRLAEGDDAFLASYDSFIAVLRPIVTAGSSGETADLRDGLAWLIDQDPTVPLSWGDNVQRLAPSGVFTNDVRWTTFRYWARDLGFATSGASISREDSGLAPNPTRAILDTITHSSWPLPVGAAVPVWDFLEALQARLPVLPTLTRSRDHDPTGRATSWALTGAHHRGWLELEAISDTGRVFFTDLDIAGGSRTVTHVIVKGEGDE